MAFALSLARQALGWVSPNPAVGAVVVREGQVVGEGFTQPPGGPHAEIVALKQAGGRAGGATLYVTLEPCCHTEKRTPPCTGAIIAAGIKEVHMASLDPNPQVSGRGRAALEAAGILTFVGEGEEEAQEINRGYLKFITTGLPFVAAKFAMSLDGKIATRSGDARWLSGPPARSFAHRLRREADAIIVGINTVLTDDPRLTARDEGEGVVKAPLRVVVDSRGRLPPQAALLSQPGQTVLAVAQPLPPHRASLLRERGAETWELPGPGGRVDLNALIRALGQRQVLSVLVEGGGILLASLIEQDLVDKIYAILCPIIIGGEQAPTPVAGRGVERVSQALPLKKVKVERLGEDTLISGYLNHATTK